MPVVRDFRNSAYSLIRIERCGRYVGRQSYSRLYAIENLLRVFIHSVLSVQINAHWWGVGVAPKVQRDASKRRIDYAKKSHHTSPGVHDIHYVYLSTLSNILRTNSHLIQPVVPDIAQWIVKIEGVLTPRNLIGHMNFPGQPDRQRIENLHREIPVLIQHLQQAGIAVQVPK